MSAEDPAFNLVVESTGTSSTLTPPPGWESTTHHVGPLTVAAHTRLPSTPSHLLGAPILTLHDVGMNAASCFASFFAFCHTPAAKCPELDAAAAHYHLTAPGHMPDAPTLPSSETVDIDVLVRAVESVIERFELHKVIAFGVGIGAAVFLRAAIRCPKTFTGLVLISPVIAPASVVEKTFVGADGLFSRQLGLALGRRAKDRFLHRWLTDAARESNFTLVQNLEDGLDRLNASNLLRLLAADIWRDDVTPKLNQVKARLLLITGKESALRHHTDDALPSFDPSNTSWLDIHECGSLVHEEYPDRVAQSISLLLEALPPIN